MSGAVAWKLANRLPSGGGRLIFRAVIYYGEDVNMKEARHIAYEELVNNLSGIIERIVQTRERVIVEGEGGAVVIMQAAQPTRPGKRRAEKFVADAAIPPVTTYTLEEMAGSVPPLPEGRDRRPVERAVKEERTERFMRKMQSA